MSEGNLPPFGVRGLCSPEKPFAVLQISQTQYDSSLHSYPDSALTWLDEDDGELVTVGSGLELKARLSDPIPSTNPRIKFHDKWTGRMDDQYIHLFDISGSQISLDVWREHEAYFSKTQTPKVNSLISSTEIEKNEAQEHESSAKSPVSPEVTPEPEVSDAESTEELGNHSNEPNTVLDLPSQTTLPGLFEGLGFQLDHLAGFLQGTSEGLRKAAEKTRECDTSPVEDVLRGMTAIIGEVGAFGLDVIDKINDTSSVSQVTTTPDLPITTEHPKCGQESPPCLDEATDNFLMKLGSMTNNATSCCEDPEENVRMACKQVLGDKGYLFNGSLLQDMNQGKCSLASTESHKIRDLERTVLIQLLALNRMETSEENGEKSSHQYETKFLGNNERVQHRNALFKLLAELHQEPTIENIVGRSMEDPKMYRQSTSCAPTTFPSSKQIAILDQENDATDAAFSARYPPLSSLKRSRTLDVLRSDEKVLAVPTRADSIKQDHTGQPRPQVFDAETQRRRDFAKLCFPTQEYTPGPGTTCLTLARPKFFVSETVQNVDQTPEDLNEPSSITTRDFAEEPSIEPGDVAGSMNSMNDLSSAKVATLEDQSTANDSPGLWPKAVDENASHETVWNEMSSILPTKGQYWNDKLLFEPSSHQSSHHRLQRHRSLMNPASKQLPASGLHRSQTVTASNPSARLSGPFSPMFPAPVTPKSFLENQQPIPKPTAGPVRNLHRSVSDRRPRSLYEPYRSGNAHRTFEPVWEGQDELARQTDPNPGVVIVDASNFEVETTEQDIRDLLAEDCRTVIGINTLISCRIIATEPQVLAKLVIKDKTNADAVIDKYNNKWINGRPLKFEYARTGIDARINRIRGALPPPQIPQPRHLRSVPDLRKASNPKPPFAAFVSQARPIASQEPTVNVAKTSMPPTPLPSQPVLPPAFAGNLIHECENQLMAMGYGQMDPALLSRLHVYACAANGDVHDAIEMIEDDRKAHDFDTFQKKVQFAREERWGVQDNQDGSDDSDAYEEDLEKAIKLSMNEK